MYRDRLIAYSLGNFCTVGFGLDGPLGLAPLLQVDLDGQGRVVSGRLASFIQRSHAGPVVDADNRAARLMYDLGRTDFGPANGLEPDGSIRRAP
jgi:hypothetical protein